MTLPKTTLDTTILDTIKYEKIDKKYEACNWINE